MPFAPDDIRLAHLLRRVGLGARPEEWQELRKLGMAGATERLLHPETVPDQLENLIAQIGDDFIDLDNLESVRQLWFFRMAHTRRPLEERMTLFWHGHFATAQYKVNNPRWMWRQNQTFRELGLGSFRTLLQSVMRDPAMLVWLDGAQNRNGAPNENFARELMELFTFGAGNGYNETDVKEAARCFTGWVIDHGDPVFTPYLHDDGAKTVLGQTGNFYPDDMLDIICARPQTARYLGGKLWKFFVGNEPSQAELKNVEDVYFSSGSNIGAMIDCIVKSSAFYAEANRYARVQSPVEFAVAQIRLLGAPLTAFRDLYRDLAGMGQDVFNPPNVKGWPDGDAWINTRTLLARVNFARRTVSDTGRRVNLAERLKPLLGDEPTTPESAAQVVWEMLRPGLPISSPARASLMAKLSAGRPAEPKNTAAEMRFAEKLPALLDIVVATPEYQLA